MNRHDLVSFLNVSVVHYLQQLGHKPALHTKGGKGLEETRHLVQLVLDHVVVLHVSRGEVLLEQFDELVEVRIVMVCNDHLFLTLKARNFAPETLHLLLGAPEGVLVDLVLHLLLHLRLHVGAEVHLLKVVVLHQNLEDLSSDPFLFGNHFNALVLLLV